MNPIKVGVNGAEGKTGRVVVRALKAEKGMEFVFGADRGDDLAALIAAAKADVVVDFTEPSAVLTNTMTIIENGARPVVGTTGLAKEDLAVLRSALEKRGMGGIVAPNFSIGALLMMRFAAEAAAYFGKCEIVEMHHEDKADSPSGTALLSAQAVNAARTEPKRKAGNGAETPDPAGGERSRGLFLDGVRVHSVRLPGLVAHQEILFGGRGETLTIRHDALSRDCFVPGILKAIREVMEISGLRVGLEI